MFYSHSKKISENEYFGVKTIAEHSANVIKNSLDLFSKQVNSQNFSNDEITELISTIAKLHDLGKYTPDFQNYLLKKDDYDNELKNHARIGAFVAFNSLINKSFQMAFIAYFIIKNHHSNLKKLMDDTFIRKDRTDLAFLSETFSKQKEKLIGLTMEIEQELNFQNLSDFLALPFEFSSMSQKEIRKNVKKLFIQSKNCENYFLINYVFSILIESDKIDASGNIIYKRKSLDKNLVDNYINYNFRNTDNLKSEIRRNVKNFVNEIDLNKDKIFTLTAPTGIGKTLTGLDFALELREKISRTTGEIPQIIYSLPFVNIIEQAIDVYNRVFEDKAKILVHYQNSNGEINSSVDYAQSLMLLETWQSDIIITSFVQLVETIITNKNRAIKRFSHLANAIVILDEIQAIEIEKLPLIGSVIYYLSKLLNTKFLLMTATKPYIFELAENLVNEKINAVELLPNHKRIFNLFKRTKIISEINKTLEDEDFINLFFEKWDGKSSALIVLNTVNRSLCIYKKLKEILDKNEIDNPIFYLSTNILPAHKLEIINKIKASLKNGENPILVSTQTVEAGVDIDFDIAFRDIAPIDSIVQVAGRVNRYGEKANYSKVYIINFGDCKKIYGSIVENIVSAILQKVKEIPEENYLDLIEEYFLEIKNRVGEYALDKSKAIWDAICKLNYTSFSDDEISISSFKLIDDKINYIQVFIEYDEKASNALKIFNDYLLGERSKEDYQKIKSIFYSYVLKIPKYYIELVNYLTIQNTEVYLIDKEMKDDYYDYNFGFKRTICETESQIEFI